MTPRAIGIDIGGTHLRAALVSSDGAILARARAASTPDPQTVLDRCLALVGEIGATEASAIGVGVPGQVDAAARRVLSGGFVDLSALDLAGALGTATGLPVAIENDATMALLAESAFGAARGCSSVVMMTIGTGIGGAVLERGRVLRGGGVAGQIGHIIVDPAGRACVCGRVGCVETVSSGTAFAAHLAEAGLPAATRAQDLLARPEDPRAAAVLAAWAAPLRAATDTLVAIFNPDLVVIGGGAGAAAMAALDRIPHPRSWFATLVVAAELGDDAGIVGAAIAALRAAPEPRPKRAVLVNGVPASGKSAVARALSDATGWPILTLDTIKDPFLAELPAGDRAFNRTLGRASYAAIFELLRDAPPGATMIIDAWFGFQPPGVLTEGLRRAGVAETAEIWCHAPPEIIGRRYGARVGRRTAGHPGAEYVPELVALAHRARPMAQGPVLPIETTRPLDLAMLIAWLGDL